MPSQEDKAKPVQEVGVALFPCTLEEVLLPILVNLNHPLIGSRKKKIRSLMS
jgi:hypothetical protein